MMDMLDTFCAHLPHLQSRAALAAEEICEMEGLLEAATAAGLEYSAAGWKALSLCFVTVPEPAAARWITQLGKAGYRCRGASCNQDGAITAHLVREDGRRIDLQFSTTRKEAS